MINAENSQELLTGLCEHGNIPGSCPTCNAEDNKDALRAETVVEMLPAHSYARAANLTKEEENRVDNFINTKGTGVQYRGEVELTVEQRNAFEVLVENQQAWAKEKLGISLERRKPEPHKLRVFDTTVFNEKRVIYWEDMTSALVK